MKIAISGCGITGATVGFLLAEQGHDITIFEQASDCQPIGAGIMLQQSGQNVLRRLGLLDDLMSVSQPLTGMTTVHPSGRQLIHLDFQRFNPEAFALGVQRGALFELLLGRCRQNGIKVNHDCRVTGFEPGSGIVLTDQAEVASGFDFLIAADGSRSVLRANSSIRVSTTEYDFAALWTTGRCDYQPGQLYQVVDGTSRLLGLLPIGEGRSSFFWGLPKHGWPSLQSTEFPRWKDEAIKLCPQAESVLAEINEFSQLVFGSYRSVNMSRWYDRNVVFLGDSAHATSPHLGQGVNLALEDAVCFVDSLAACGTFEAACKDYSQKRFRKIRYYRQLTNLLTPFFQSHGSIRAFGRDCVLPWLPKTPYVGRQMLKTLAGQKNGWMG